MSNRGAPGIAGLCVVASVAAGFAVAAGAAEATAPDTVPAPVSMPAPFMKPGGRAAAVKRERTPPLPASREDRWEFLLDGIGYADSARVVRLVPSADGDSARPVVWAPATAAVSAGPDWCERFAFALGRTGVYYPYDRCVVDRARLDRAAAIEARFTSKRFPETTVRVIFREMCAGVTRAGHAVGMAEIDPNPILALAKEALPADTVLQKAPPMLRPWTSRPVDVAEAEEEVVDAAVDSVAGTTEPAPSGPTGTPSTSECPPAGDHVYVTVLPEAMTTYPPDYPPLARDAGVQGTVTVQALVGTDGTVREVRIAKSIPMLDKAAEECARRWRFEPGLSEGKPICAWVAIPIRFALEHEPDPAP